MSSLHSVFPPPCSVHSPHPVILYNFNLHGPSPSRDLIPSAHGWAGLASSPPGSDGSALAPGPPPASGGGAEEGGEAAAPRPPKKAESRRKRTRRTVVGPGVLGRGGPHREPSLREKQQPGAEKSAGTALRRACGLRPARGASASGDRGSEVAADEGSGRWGPSRPIPRGLRPSGQAGGRAPAPRLGSGGPELPVSPGSMAVAGVGGVVGGSWAPGRRGGGRAGSDEDDEVELLQVHLDVAAAEASSAPRPATAPAPARPNQPLYARPHRATRPSPVAAVKASSAPGPAAMPARHGLPGPPPA